MEVVKEQLELNLCNLLSQYHHQVIEPACWGCHVENIFTDEKIDLQIGLATRWFLTRNLVNGFPSLEVENFHGKIT